MKKDVAMTFGCLVLCITASGFVLGQNQKVVCSVSADKQSSGNVEVMLEMRSVTVEGQVHQIGGSDLAHSANASFAIVWDSTVQTMVLTRKDTDGFETYAIGYGSKHVKMTAKRPNHDPEDTKMECHLP